MLAVLATALISCGVFSQSAQAVPLNGSINFAGATSLNGDVNTATTATFGPVAATTTTGSYSMVPFGTAVTFNALVFDSFASPAPNLWSLTTAGGDTFAMTADTLIMVDRNAGNPLGSLEVRGSGIASGTGFDDTPGLFILTFNTADNGTTFSFSSSNSALPAGVPDGGSTAALLGLTFVGITVVRQRMMPAV